MPHNSTLMVAMLTILLSKTQSSNKGIRRGFRNGAVHRKPAPTSLSPRHELELQGFSLARQTICASLTPSNRVWGCWCRLHFM